MTKQLHIYSVDTSAFYNSDEVSVYNKLSELTKQKASCEKTDAKEINKQIKEMKEQLKSTLNNDGIPQTRNLNVAFLNKRNIVSVFDSALTRTLNMTKEDIVYEDLIIVRAFFFDVLRDLVRNGFYLRDEKYVCFTASAGQIRTKKTVFIKESLLTKHQATLMCGLTVDDINLRGGVNVNKYLAYLARCNSATDVWGRLTYIRVLWLRIWKRLLMALWTSSLTPPIR